MPKFKEETKRKTVQPVRKAKKVIINPLSTKKDLPASIPELIGQFRNRIKRFAYVDVSLIDANPDQWKDHDLDQIEVTSKVMGEVGFSGALLLRETKNGRYELVDGHMRTGMIQEGVAPALITDLSKDEAKKILLTHDLITQMAGKNLDKAQALFDQDLFSDPQVKEMIASVLQLSEEFNFEMPESIGTVPSMDTDSPPLVEPQEYNATKVGFMVSVVVTTPEERDEVVSLLRSKNLNPSVEVKRLN